MNKIFGVQCPSTQKVIWCLNLIIENNYREMDTISLNIIVLIKKKNLFHKEFNVYLLLCGWSKLYHVIPFINCNDTLAQMPNSLPTLITQNKEATISHSLQLNKESINYNRVTQSIWQHFSYISKNFIGSYLNL